MKALIAVISTVATISAIATIASVTFQPPCSAGDCGTCRTSAGTKGFWYDNRCVQCDGRV